MIEPQEIHVNGKTFLIGKYPAIAGREIIANYPLTALPKIGDYPANQRAMYKLMNYVYITVENGSTIALSTPELVDKYTGDWETLVKVEWESLRYNCSFFQNGKVSDFLKDFAQNLEGWISKILTVSLAQLSPTEKQPS